MNNIRIDTLTPVHIGSGESLQYNTDYVVDQTSDGTYAYIVDPGKVLDLIGSNHISNWTSAIERGYNTLKLVRTYSPQAVPSQFSTRSIFCTSPVLPGYTLQACLHDGRGLPYIPGSAIKGAIRTAILSQIVNPNQVTKQDITKIVRNRQVSSAQKVEAQLFGDNPKSNIFRFIRVGDAYFQKQCETASRLILLNIRHSSNDLIDQSKSNQLFEAIDMDCSAQCNITIDISKYQFSLNNWGSSKERPLGTIDNRFNNLQSLFCLIKSHTQQLVESEIDYWTKIPKTGADSYIAYMKTILSHINNCSESECVLRIGHSSGWRFITGAWTENLDSNLYSKVVSDSRPGNERRYSGYDFPKTCQIDVYSTPFGFVKLTILPQNASKAATALQ